LYNYNPNQDKELYEAYKIVRNSGVTLFDTADSYGTLDLNGRAELLLGSFERQYQQEEGRGSYQETNTSYNNNIIQLFLQRLSTVTTSSSLPPSSTKQQVATKIAPYPWRLTPQSIVQATRASLKRLGQEKLTLAQLHWSTSNYLPLQERALWDGIANVYEQNLCDAVGVSNYGPRQLIQFAQQMELRQVPVATAQIQCSLLTYKDPITRDLIDICRNNNSNNNNNIRLIAYSPLGLGMLTGKYNLQRNILPSSGPRRQLFREILPSAEPLLNLLKVIATEEGKTQSQIAINWALCKGCVPIPAARTVTQATENVGSVGWRLSNAAIEELDRTALSISKPMIQNIFQTK
jgi:pyridoxine 4-dehydrogenase